ncbi:ABC transporter substrate-binding protein [Yinghuangia seranimata]|uniref:ABC transporter substrate-binding protein n=1 Tax=Yinghuangia seranimata TaxID=408067 RepID=UPI00248A95DA|nr:ABC transporter substrate-binding protein [Yinghuangia seranimata]MDI2129222.1 ABC transporter substrate-binding protein [Yinghuangia seranimata]
MTALSARRRSIAAGAVLVAGALLLTGCGSDDKKSDSGSSSAPGGTGGGSAPSGAAAPLYAKVPQQYKDAKVIKVGSDVAYAPNEYFDTDGKTIIGMDPDLGAALSKQLGVDLKFQNGAFDDLITSMQSKRIDIIMSSMSDTKSRQDGLDKDGKKVGDGVDFVDYFNAGTSILVQKGNPKGIKTLDDLCGKTIALQKGTTQEDIANKQNDKCAASGKGKMEILTFEKDTEALLQLKQGRSVADLNDFPVAAYNAQTASNGKDFEVTGEQLEAGPYGIALRKDDTALRDVLKEAMDNIIKNGDYAKILEARKLQQGAVQSATVNGGS